MTLGHLRHPQALVDRYSDITEHAAFYLDPHVCMRCRYRSTGVAMAMSALSRLEYLRRGALSPARDATG